MRSSYAGVAEESKLSYITSSSTVYGAVQTKKVSYFYENICHKLRNKTLLKALPLKCFAVLTVFVHQLVVLGRTDPTTAPKLLVSV